MIFPFQLDVIFTKEGPVVSVNSKLFPGCLGVGLDECEALGDLKRSIKTYLKESVDAAVESFFAHPIYEDIRLGAKQSRKRVGFDMVSEGGLDAWVRPKKNLMVSFPLTHYVDDRSDASLPLDIERYPSYAAPSQVRSLFEQLGLGQTLTGVHPGAVPYVSGSTNALVMGIPLNLN